MAICFVLMFLLWLILTGGDFRTWWFGLLAAAIAAGASMLLPGERRSLSVTGLVRFVPFFVRQSLEGGFDVARRAFHPRMPIDPAIVSYSVRLPEGPASVFLAAVISLLPGTLTAELRDRLLLVHVLDVGLPVIEKLRTLEEKVGTLFGMKLEYADSKESRS